MQEIHFIKKRFETTEDARSSSRGGRVVFDSNHRTIFVDGKQYSGVETKTQTRLETRIVEREVPSDTIRHEKIRKQMMEERWRSEMQRQREENRYSHPSTGGRISNITLHLPYSIPVRNCDHARWLRNLYGCVPC